MFGRTLILLYFLGRGSELQSLRRWRATRKIVTDVALIPRVIFSRRGGGLPLGARVPRRPAGVPLARMPPARTPTVVATGAPADASPRERVVALRVAIRTIVEQQGQVLTKDRKKDAYLEALRGWMDALDEATATAKEAPPQLKYLGNLRADRKRAREAVYDEIQKLLPGSGVQVPTEEAPSAPRVAGQQPFQSRRTAYVHAQRHRAQQLKRDDPEAYERAVRMQTAHGIVLEVQPELDKALRATPETETNARNFLAAVEDWLAQLQVEEQTADLEDAAVDLVASWPIDEEFCRARHEGTPAHALAKWLQEAKRHQRDVRALAARLTQNGQLA